MKAGSRRIFKVSSFTEAKDTENPFSSGLKTHIHVLLAFWKDSFFPSSACTLDLPYQHGARCVPSCNIDGNS